MRNLFLLLLAANLMFAGWQYFVRDDREPGIERVAMAAPSGASATAAAPIEPGAQNAVDSQAGATAEVPASEPAVPAYVARCVSVGPFETDADARTEEQVLSGQGLTLTSRSKNGQVFSGRWVYVDNVRTRAESNTLLRRLQSGGLEEAYRIPDEEKGGYVISLGVFSTENGAKTVREKAEALGFEVAVEPRYKDVPEYYLDVQVDSPEAEADLVNAYGESLLTISDGENCER